MKVVVLWEWDNPKDEARDKKRREFGTEVLTPYWRKLVEEKGIKSKGDWWSDNTGHMVSWFEFETLEDFAKMWNDERFQQIWARLAFLVDNARIRLLRQAITIPEDLW